MICIMHLSNETIAKLLTERLQAKHPEIQQVLVHAVYDAAGVLIVSSRGLDAAGVLNVYKHGLDPTHQHWGVVRLNQAEMIRELIAALNARQIGAFAANFRFYDSGLYDLRGGGKLSDGRQDALRVQFSAVIAEPTTKPADSGTAPAIAPTKSTTADA